MPLVRFALYLISMRIVVDYAGISPLGRARPGVSSLHGTEEVLVVHVGRSDAPAEQARPSEGRWRTSDEAQNRDREVRGHENAHLSTLGPYAASGIVYNTVTGADGESIAIGGHIDVDLSEVPGDPEATMRKARTIINAAEAPGDPSAADMQVAARAYRLIQQAQSELLVDESA